MPSWLHDNAQIAIARGVERRKALIDGAMGPVWGLLGSYFYSGLFFPSRCILLRRPWPKLLKPLFVVLAISLGLSWLLALTQTTSFGNFMLKDQPSKDGKDPYHRPLYKKFEGILAFLIRRRVVSLCVVVGAFVLSLVAMGLLPQKFFPYDGQALLQGGCLFPRWIRHQGGGA